MDENEFALVSALMKLNEDMRVIAVGDDDQNIYEFRGSDSKYLRTLIDEYGANKYEMTENYRSCRSVVSLSNEFAKSISNRMKETPCEAVSDEEGIVKIIKHTSSNMEEAVVNDLLSDNNLGKVSVLTNTNDEALKILGLLNKNGKRAKLIQSLDGFKLSNLLEARAFLRAIDKNLHSPVISDDIWSKAKIELFSKYHDSACIENVKRMILDFEAVYSTKYRTDLEEFIIGSSFEDFYDDSEQETIYVSTIHKAKGREFDSVYMMLRNSHTNTDEERRKLYVGMTRAKYRLHIHTNTDIFDRYRESGVQYWQDDARYDEPSEIMLQTTHRDVVLDFFKNKKEIIFSLKSGMSLKLDGVYISAELNGRDVHVAKFSKAFAETLEKLGNKGYKPIEITLRFIVAWKAEEDNEETPVLLFNVKLGKENV